MKTIKIDVRHIQLAIRKGQDLDVLEDGVIISGGGVVPHIHKSRSHTRVT